MMVVEQLPALDYNLHYEKSLYHPVPSYILVQGLEYRKNE